MTIFKTITRLWRSKELSRSEKDVLIFLADHTAKHPTSHLSMASIASVTLASSRTVAYAISKGERLGILVRVPHRALRGGKVCKVENSYRFIAQPLMRVVPSAEAGPRASSSMCKQDVSYSPSKKYNKPKRARSAQDWLEVLQGLDDGSITHESLGYSEADLIAQEDAA